MSESPLLSRSLPTPIKEGIRLYERIRDDRLPQMAASLAYRSLVGLVPVLVVATVAARSLMADRFPEFVGEIISALGLQGIEVMSDGKAVALDTWVRSLVAQASGVNLSTLSWISVVIVLATAIWLVAGIEDSLNQIAHSRSTRTWSRRIILYWFLLTAGPVILAVVPFASGKLAGVADALPQWEWLLSLAKLSMSVGLTWLLLWVIYTVVPTTELKIRDLMLGALAAAVLIELGRRFLGLYLVHLVGGKAGVYSSLGVAPIFMLWLYFMWMFVLLGVSLASHVDDRRRAYTRLRAMQAPHG
ncbi:MAG: YihY/virulence factor BrkB family protein [Phycisphaeraceae bacterium]|nr:YihY/virulence factor BrkB family protein [Phycisphaeraceae bacterium]